MSTTLFTELEQTLQKDGAEAALDRKAADLVALDVSGLTSYADTFIIATATSDRHARG